MKSPGESRNRRILIVDDNRDIHGDFRKILGGGRNQSAYAAAEASVFGEPADAISLAEFELDTAFQGQEALELVQRALTAGKPYAMAFVDMRMPPGWDGAETIARIWRVDPDLQIVLCTAYSDYSWDEIRGKLGQSDRLLILKKPFDNIEVLQLASALTEKWHFLKQAHRQVGELEERVRQRTAELSENEMRYRLITENTGDLVEIVDAMGKSLYRSPSCARLFGPPPPDQPETTFAFYAVHPDDRPAVVAAMQESLRTGQQQVRDFRARHADGSWRTLETHCGPFRNDRGLVEGVLFVSRDVTERRRLELQLRQAQKLDSIGQLATGIAHEINTPTQFIGDNAHFLRTTFASVQDLLARYGELLAAAETGAITSELCADVRASCAEVNPDYLAIEIPKALDDILLGVARTAKIVKAMRNFANPDAAHKKSIELCEMVEDALTITRNEWREIAEVVTEFDPALPPVPVFPGEFSQVLLNLIVNAAQTIADRTGDGRKGKGVITVSARGDGDWVEVRVRDTGMGIPDDMRDRVYDPFFTTKTTGKSTGQGLSLARSVVVQQHGGSLTFESVVGEGTVFIVRLPLLARGENSGSASGALPA